MLRNPTALKFEQQYRDNFNPILTAVYRRFGIPEDEFVYWSSFFTWKQRMAIGIILVNAQLGVMLLSESIVSGQPMIKVYCIGFIALIFALTLSFVYLSYSKKE